MKSSPQERLAELAKSLDPFFCPKVVAVIGASSDPEKIGGRPIAGSKVAGFKGKIVPVNPHHAEVQGLPAVKSVGDITDPVDLAVIAVPSSDVLSAVKQCAAKGVRGAIIFSAGFAEVDAKGKELQDEIVSIANAAGMQIMGPNCMGTINLHADSWVRSATHWVRLGPPRAEFRSSARVVLGDPICWALLLRGTMD